jgi:hypothetical protein
MVANCQFIKREDEKNSFGLTWLGSVLPLLFEGKMVSDLLSEIAWR